MARLWLIAVLLLLSASAINSQMNSKVERPSKPDETQIAEIVNNLWNRLSRPTDRKLPMFSLAVRIPYNKKKKEYDVSKVTVDLQTVRNKIESGAVYRNERMVAATLLKWDDVLKWNDIGDGPEEDVSCKNCPTTRMTWAQIKTECPHAVEGRTDHAEYRVLQNFNSLTKNLNRDEFLLFYVLASPCDHRCASESHSLSILNKIKVIKKWANYAVVFSYVFKPKGGAAVSPENLIGALERLGARIGLENIYRCDGSVPCTKCSSSDDVVTRSCYEDPKPTPSNNPSVNVPQRAKPNVPSQGGKNKNKSPGGQEKRNHDKH